MRMDAHRVEMRNLKPIMTDSDAVAKVPKLSRAREPMVTEDQYARAHIASPMESEKSALISRVRKSWAHKLFR